MGKIPTVILDEEKEEGWEVWVLWEEWEIRKCGAEEKDGFCRICLRMVLGSISILQLRTKIAHR